MLDVELKDAFDEVGWEVPPEVESRAREINAVPAEVVYYAAREALRNAARHARPEIPGSALRLTVSGRWRDGLEIVIEDNGVGLGESQQQRQRAGLDPAQHDDGGGQRLAGAGEHAGRAHAGDPQAAGREPAVTWFKARTKTLTIASILTSSTASR